MKKPGLAGVLVAVAVAVAVALGWLDQYHEQVLALIGPQLEGEDRTWLETQCAQLGG